MPDYLKSFDTILPILLGWVLGWLTPAIAERIRRPQRRRDLMQAIVEEMLGLQYIMASVAYEIRKRYADVSDAFLDKILPIIGEYHGPDRIEDFFERMKTNRRFPEPQRAAAYQALQKPNVGLVLKQYALPFFASQVADLVICTLDFQRSVARIRCDLDLYNQIVPYKQSLFEKTFNKPSPEDREVLVSNLEDAYREAGKRAEIIMQAIDELKKQYGTAR